MRSKLELKAIGYLVELAAEAPLQLRNRGVNIKSRLIKEVRRFLDEEAKPVTGLDWRNYREVRG
jgi:hypothetical protein